MHSQLLAKFVKIPEKGCRRKLREGKAHAAVISSRPEALKRSRYARISDDTLTSKRGIRQDVDTHARGNQHAALFRAFQAGPEQIAQSR